MTKELMACVTESKLLMTMGFDTCHIVDYLLKKGLSDDEIIVVVELLHV